MTQTVEALFDSAIERYQAGEDPEVLIPTFKEICNRAPKSSSAWTCLSWLYLLNNKPTSAYKAAQKAVKLNPQDPQARINLAMAMIETSQKGVRPHVELAAQILLTVDELEQEVKKNFEEGLSKKPDWKSLKQVQRWIFED